MPPVDAIEDLHGDMIGAELGLFMNGNQFMVMDELVDAFLRGHPEVHGAFYETLPPGVLVQQVRSGALRMGRLLITRRADVLAASPDALEQLAGEGLVRRPIVYAANDLAILVPDADHAGVEGLADLGRPGVRVAMPDPRTEGVGQLISRALERAGGPSLRTTVMEEKVARGETRLTQIHHRQSALWLLAGEVDAAPLWSTEARYHQGRGAPFRTVAIPDDHNVTGRYGAAVVEGGGDRRRGEAFLEFLLSATAAAIYASYGFQGPGT